MDSINHHESAPSFSSNNLTTPTKNAGAGRGTNKRGRPRRDEDGFSEAYLSRYGLAVVFPSPTTPRPQDLGSSHSNADSTKTLECRFCRVFGREKSPRAIREVARSAKTFTPPFKTDYFVEHLRHSHPHRWGEYSGLSTDGERMAYWETSGEGGGELNGGLDAAQVGRRPFPPGPPFAERRQPPSIDPATMTTPPQPSRRRQRVGRSQSNSGAGSNAGLEPLPQVGYRKVSSSTDSDGAAAARAAALSLLAIPVSPAAHPRPHTLRTFRFQRGRSRINDLLCRIRPGDTMAQIVQKAQAGDALNVFGVPTPTTATALQGRRPRSFRASPPPTAGVRLYTIDGVGSFSEKVFAAIPVLDVLALCPTNPLVVRLEYRRIESSSSSDEDDSRDGGSSAPSSSATTSSLEGSAGAAPAPDEHSLEGPRHHRRQNPHHHGNNSEDDDDDDDDYDGEPIEFRGTASAHDNHEEDQARVPSPVPLRYIHLAPALDMPHPPPPPHPTAAGGPPRPYPSPHPSGGGGAAHWPRESSPSHRF